jgi:hypothetical protein
MNEKDRKSLMKDKIKLIYPSRKNMKKKTNKHAKKLLKFRYTIEHIFLRNFEKVSKVGKLCFLDQSLKKYNRINIRRDRTIKSFLLRSKASKFKFF